MAREIYFYDKSKKGIYDKGEPKKITYSITDEMGQPIVTRKDMDVTDGMKEIQRIASRRNAGNPFASMNKDIKTLFGGSK